MSNKTPSAAKAQRAVEDIFETIIRFREDLHRHPELSWQEFGRLICTYAGWGMRIEFVPENETHRRPTLEVREPQD